MLSEYILLNIIETVATITVYGLYCIGNGVYKFIRNSNDKYVKL